MIMCSKQSATAYSHTCLGCCVCSNSCCLRLDIGGDSSTLKGALKALRRGDHKNCQRIEVAFYGYHRRFKPRQCAQVLLAMAKLPHIQEITIGGIEASSAVWVKFFCLLRDKLRVLRIFHCSVIPSVWEKVVHSSCGAVGIPHADMAEWLSAVRQLTKLQAFQVQHWSEWHSLHKDLLLFSLASIPSLKTIQIGNRGSKSTRILGARSLRPVLQSCQCLEELVIQDCIIRKDVWPFLVSSVLEHHCLKTLRLGQAEIDATALIHLEQLLGTNSPLIGFQVMPYLESGEDRDTWKIFVTKHLPRALQSNTRLKWCFILFADHLLLDTGRILSKGYQKVFLDVLKRHNKTLEDLALRRWPPFKPFYPFQSDNDKDVRLGGFAEPSEMEQVRVEREKKMIFPHSIREFDWRALDCVYRNPDTLRIRHFLKLNQYGRQELEAEDADETTIINVLARAAGDVPCLYYFLQQHLALFEACTRQGGRRSFSCKG